VGFLFLAEARNIILKRTAVGVNLKEYENQGNDIVTKK
jgi:hypothetical protein